MAIPLRVPSPILLSNDIKNKAFVSNTPKESPKDSAYQSQILNDISSSGGPYNVGSSSPPLIRDTNDRRLEYTLGDQQQYLHFIDRMKELNADEGSIKDEREEEILLSKAVDQAFPPSVGSLDKFVSALDAEHDMMQGLPLLVEELSLPPSTLHPETADAFPVSHSTGLENKAAICDLTFSENNQLESRASSSPVTSIPAGVSWSQAGRGKALQQILSAASKPVGRLSPVVSPSFEILPKVSPVSVPSAELIDECSNTPALRKSRKGKISLAIKFQGTAESPLSAATESKQGNPSILKCGPSSVNKTPPQGLMKPSAINCKIPSPEIHDQVPGRDQNTVVVGCKVSEEATSSMTPAVGGVEMRASMLLSSDGEDGEFSETRAGRNANDLEMSIAQHQRNIHRDMVSSDKRNCIDTNFCVCVPWSAANLMCEEYQQM